MSKVRLEYLYKLVRSMGQSEKRSFKLFSQRSFNDQKELNFVHLFDVLNKMKVFNEKTCRSQLKIYTPKQVSDLKFNLNYHILQSLRIVYSRKHDFKIREMIDFAHILYKKGFFNQSLSQLEKAKSNARLIQNHTLELEIIEFEKKIESRHVTYSHSKRAEQLTTELNSVRMKIRLESSWSDLSLNLYEKYLQIGHVKSEEEHLEFEIFFHNQIPKKNEQAESFYSELFKTRSYVWYYYIQQDFKYGYKYALSWLWLFRKNPQFVEIDPLGVIKAYHNCLSVLFYSVDNKRHSVMLKQLLDFIERHEENLDANSRSICFVYSRTAMLNAIILAGEFSQRLDKVILITQEIERHEGELDHHRLMVFWYKIGSIYFSGGDNRACIRMLNRIINQSDSTLKEDVQSFARILNLVAHFELGNDDLLFYRIKSVYRFLLKMKNLQPVQMEFMKFLRSSVYMDRTDMKEDFVSLKVNLEKIRENKFERRPFLYLDIISWLESKITGEAVDVVIRRSIALRG